MKRKVLVIIMILMFFSSDLVFISVAEVTEKNINETYYCKLVNSPPTIDSVKYLGCRKSGSEFKVIFLVRAIDSDGDYIGISYRKSEFDNWWNYPDTLPTPASFNVEWNMKRGSYTAYFKAYDNFGAGAYVNITYNVPKPRGRTGIYIFSLQDFLNINLFERLFY